MMLGDSRGRDRMVVGFTTICAISTYNHQSCDFEFRSWWSVIDTTLCDKVCQWLVTGCWFYPGTPISSTNKNWPPPYNWNIVESGVKHHKQTIHLSLVLLQMYPFYYYFAIIFFHHISGKVIKGPIRKKRKIIKNLHKKWLRTLHIVSLSIINT